MASGEVLPLPGAVRHFMIVSTATISPPKEVLKDHYVVTKLIMIKQQRSTKGK